MKKIINGKRYDTDAAKLVGEAQSTVGRNDSHFWREELYRKRTGEFFIYGEGGGMTKYAKAVDLNSWTGGEAIRPISEEEAKQWAEEYLTVDEYEKWFDVEEDVESGSTQTSINISKAAMNKLKVLADNSGLSRSKVIDELIMDKK